MTTILEALAGLTDALDQLAAALVSGEAESVLRAETSIAAALERLSLVVELSNGERVKPDDRLQIASGVGAVLRAMIRCEALGRSTADLVQALVPTTYGQRPPVRMGALFTQKRSERTRRVAGARA